MLRASPKEVFDWARGAQAMALNGNKMKIIVDLARIHFANDVIPEMK